MFLTGSLRGGNLGAPDPTEERDPPPEPTPITFPKYEPGQCRAWSEESPAPYLRTLFSRVLKPSDISRKHEEALNVTCLPACGVDELVPLASDGSSYVPSVPPLNSGNDNAGKGAEESDPAEARKQRDLADRFAELRIENELAFEVINRTVTQGVKPPRLAHMRKFFESLESMSQYWDCSLDQYYEALQPEFGEESNAKRQRLDTYQMDIACLNGQFSEANHKHPSQCEHSSEKQDQAPEERDSNSAINHNQKIMNGTEHAIATAGHSEGTENGMPSSRSTMRYKGRRTATGRAMPDQFRADTVKAFVEGAIWPFRSSLSPPRMMPILQIEKLNLPVRQTAAAYRVPNDRMRARQGWLEGPVFNIQARGETDFQDKNEGIVDDKSRLDFMREIGGLLHIAQERRREGKTETKPGEGEWWTTKPRWGGGQGGEVQNEVGNSDVVGAAEEALEASEDGSVKRQTDGSRGRKRKTPAMLWKELKPSKGYWDPKTVYTAIGTRPESEYDEVFLVSSLNHHISIVKMTVHGAYIDCITSGVMPDPIPQDNSWSSPSIQRSRWFDLFDVDDRQQAFRGLWGITAYLTRQSSDASAKPTAQGSTNDVTK